MDPYEELREYIITEMDRVKKELFDRLDTVEQTQISEGLKRLTDGMVNVAEALKTLSSRLASVENQLSEAAE